ncbi:MAG: CIS tube protein [Acidiferrobacterales bacterium]
MPAITLSKGALVRLESRKGTPRAIVFPYNPESLQHSLRVATPSDILAAPGQAATPATTVIEMIRFTLVLDHADAMQTLDPSLIAPQTGLHPILSALELLLREDAQLPANGATVFVWGTKRIVPVRLVELDVQERLFDPSLNPLHAIVHVTLRALDGTEPGAGGLIPSLFVEHQDALTQLAQTVYTSSMQVQEGSSTV